MIKKFISMATATLLLVTGLAVVVAPAASATTPVIASTSAITAGQVNPSVSITTSNTFNASQTASHYVFSGGATGLTRSAVSISGSTVTLTLGGTANPGTATLAIQGAAFQGSLTSNSNTLSFVIAAAPATNGVMVFIGGSGVIANATAPFTISGGNGQWNTSGSLTWSPSLTSNRFAAGVVYTATVEVSANGWNFEGLSSNFFSISGATSVSATYSGSPRDRAAITMVFPSTAAPVNLGLSTSSTGGGSTPAPTTPTPTAAEIAAAAAAAAKAAEEAAAIARAAEIAKAQNALATVLKGDKAGTLSEYRSANIYITTAASLARINAEVLKLSVSDRADFAKIKAIADKIEFDESFFNATARPSLATYSSYGVTGVTERILPTINAKVLELPAAKRIDAAAIKEIVKVESFVDLVANTATRESVTSTRLIEKGLLPADTPYKHSVRSGLAFYPEGSLNTMAKIEAAIKAELVKAGARKAKTAEIREKIAARRR